MQLQQCRGCDSDSVLTTTAVFSVMVESARIARGAVKPLSELTPDSADAVVIPGGFGAAKNLCDFGFKVSGLDSGQSG